jgi:hypothetical protein
LPAPPHGLADFRSNLGIAHDVGIDSRDVHIGVSVPQHFGDRVCFLSADEASAANVPDDIFGSKNVPIHQREIPDARHHQLEGHIRASRTTPGYEHPDISKKLNVKKGLDSLEGPILIAHPVFLRPATRRFFAILHIA